LEISNPRRIILFDDEFTKAAESFGISADIPPATHSHFPKIKPSATLF
jgi:hypothetical protein